MGGQHQHAGLAAQLAGAGEGAQPVDRRLHLRAGAVPVDRRAEDDHIGLLQLRVESDHVVVDGAAMVFPPLAGTAVAAGSDRELGQPHLGDRVTVALGRAQQFVDEQLRVAALSRAAEQGEYLHRGSFLCQAAAATV